MLSDDHPIYQAPVLFGTRGRTAPPPVPIWPTAGIDPCPTLLALRARRGGDPPW
jgi:hypothetical protein